MAVTRNPVRPPRPDTAAAQPAPEFPGCTPVHLPALEHTADAARLAQVGVLILDYATGAELLDRVAGNAARWQ